MLNNKKAIANPKQKLLSVICFLSVGLMVYFVRMDQSEIILKTFNSSVSESESANINKVSISVFAKLDLTCGGKNETSPGKIISFSLFNGSDAEEMQERFLKPLEVNIGRIRKLYPDWEVRIYHDSSFISLPRLPSYAHYCSISRIPLRQPNMLNSLFIDLSWVNPRVWRFLPLLDPAVTIFLSRDVDSLILEREVAAVEEWLCLDRTFHVMRDHPQHSAFILAGMWGVRLDHRRAMLREAVVNIVLNSQDGVKSTDQKLLAHIMWPLAKMDSVIHDAYSCNSLWIRGRDLVLPFPTARKNFTFVGNVVTMSPQVREQCPVECRPKEHQDWTYC